MSAPLWPYLALPGLLVGIAARSTVWYLAVGRPPRRTCPACSTVPNRTLIPVRLFIGRCRVCGYAPPPPAFVPELLGAGGFALAGWIGGGGFRVAALCWLVAFSLSAVLVDAAIQRLPDVLTWPCLAGVLVLLLGQTLVAGSAADGVRTMLAGCVVAGFFLTLALIADMGLGDVKLAGSLGAVLGYVSWYAVLAGLTAGFCIAGLHGVRVIATRGRGLSTQLPLGPALLAGTVLVLALTAR